ncbi:unnamed protein product [Microthlaspi erraticum]|uniref:CNNM transmembrane domain-containing protein n=1 Tax=Microthlaspi erraticum TaxID=1685480 RepID=A0A6D2K7B2_9BRAS|nr:unnamed protein product [Microthlaspi erraticum]
MSSSSSDSPCCGTTFWLFVMISIALVAFVGLMSGLTLGLMSLGLVDLEVLIKSGRPQDRINAGPYGMKVPQLTPSRVRLLSCNRTFDSSKAKDRLGYAPVVPLQEGIKRTIDSFSHLKAQNQPEKEVTDSVQWKKQTLIAIVILITLYHNFVATTGSSVVVTALSKVLLVASIFMFVNGILPEKMKLFGSKKKD